MNRLRDYKLIARTFDIFTPLRPTAFISRAFILSQSVNSTEVLIAFLYSSISVVTQYPGKSF